MEKKAMLIIGIVIVIILVASLNNSTYSIAQVSTLKASQFGQCSSKCIIASQEENYSYDGGQFTPANLYYLLNDSRIGGLEFYIPASSLNPSSGTYDPTVINNDINLAAKYGKKSVIVIYTTSYSSATQIDIPSWWNVPMIPSCGGGGITPDYVSNNFITNYRALESWIVSTYGSNQNVLYFRFQQGVEMAYSFKVYDNSAGCQTVFANYNITGATWQAHLINEGSYLGSLHSGKPILMSLNSVPSLNVQTVADAYINDGLGIGDQGNAGTCFLGNNPNDLNLCNLPSSIRFLQPLSANPSLSNILTFARQNNFNYYEIPQQTIICADNPTNGCPSASNNQVLNQTALAWGGSEINCANPIPAGNSGCTTSTSTSTTPTTTMNQTTTSTTTACPFSISGCTTTTTINATTTMPQQQTNQTGQIALGIVVFAVIVGIYIYLKYKK